MIQDMMLDVSTLLLKITAMKVEFLKAEILNICKTDIVISADGWAVTGAMGLCPPLGHVLMDKARIFV